MILAHHPRSYSHWLAIEFLIGLGLIFLPTFLMGMLLPLVVRLYAQVRGGVGEAVGEVYAWNTMGAILGSFICGFFLISWLGVRNSLSLACALSLLLGIIFILAEKLRILLRISAAMAAILLGLIFFLFQPGWDPEIISSGPYLYYKDYFSQGAKARERIIENLKSANKTLFHKEGVEATVSVFELTDHTLALRINGKTDASTGVDMTTQVFTGHLPLLLHPDPKKVAVIGLASGVTLGSVLTHPIDEAVCLEISPEVAEASQYFSSVNRRPLEDRRTRLVIDDGRYFLEHTRESFDVIISEPSNPWIGGMGLLFTQEFFSQAKARLNPGGMMLIWVGVYDLDLESVRMIARTFLNLFPETSVWESIPGGDYLLIGFNGKMDLDYSRLKSRMQDAKVRDDLTRVNLESPEKLAARFLMGPEELKNFAQGGPLHRDDRRQLELGVPELRYMQTFKENLSLVLKGLIQYRVNPEKYFRFSNPADAQDQGTIDRFYQARVWIMEAHIALMNQENLPLVTEKLLEANQIDPNDKWVKDNLYFAYYFRGEYYLRHKKFSEAANNLSKAWEYNPSGSEIPSLASFYYLARGDFSSAQIWAMRALEKNQKDPIAWMMRGKLELKQGRPELAIKSLERSKQYWPTIERLKDSSLIVKTIIQANPVDLKAELFSDSGEANFQLGNFQQALADFEEALAIDSGLMPARLGSGKTLLELGQIQPAIERLSQSARLAPRNPRAHFYLARALAQIPERKQEAIQEYKTFLNLAPKDSPERKSAEKALSVLTPGD